jgi:hypothetical protein
MPCLESNAELHAGDCINDSFKAGEVVLCLVTGLLTQSYGSGTSALHADCLFQHDGC